MIVLTAPTQFSVAPPAQVTSLDYQAELASIKSAQAQLTERPAQVDRLLEQGRRPALE